MIIIQRAGTSVLELEIQATALLAYAMSELNDPFAISAFCSDGKEDVYIIIELRTLIRLTMQPHKHTWPV